MAPVDYQRRGIQVEEQAPRSARHNAQLLQEAIVEPAQPRQGRRRHTQQKASQGRGIRVVRQPAQVLKDTIDLQQVRRLDPFETEDQRINDRQQQFADAVAVDPLDQTNIHRHRFLETNPSQKTMEQIDAPVMREASVSEGDGKFSCARKTGLGVTCHDRFTQDLG